MIIDAAGLASRHILHAAAKRRRCADDFDDSRCRYAPDSRYRHSPMLRRSRHADQPRRRFRCWLTRPCFHAAAASFRHAADAGFFA